MPSIDDIYSGNYLKASDLIGKPPRPARIIGYSVKEFGQNGKKENKLVLSFEGTPKQLVVNKTNASIISSNFGTKDYTAWVGRSITVVAKKIDARGEIVDAIRVVLEEARPLARAAEAAIQQQAPRPATANRMPDQREEAPSVEPEPDGGMDDVPF